MHVIKLACSPPKRKCSTRKQIKSRSFLYEQEIRALELDGLMCFHKAYSRLQGFSLPGSLSVPLRHGCSWGLAGMAPCWPVRTPPPPASCPAQQPPPCSLFSSLRYHHLYCRGLWWLSFSGLLIYSTDCISAWRFPRISRKVPHLPSIVSAEWILCVAKCLLVSFNLRHRYHLATFLLCLWAHGPLPAASGERVYWLSVDSWFTSNPLGHSQTNTVWFQKVGGGVCTAVREGILQAVQSR